MKVGLFSTNNCSQNSVKNVSKNISFGELDGDFYDSPRMTRYERKAREDRINEKYDRMRSSYLCDADDMDFSNSVVWQQLKNIEEMRRHELSQID